MRIARNDLGLPDLPFKFVKLHKNGKTKYVCMKKGCNAGGMTYSAFRSHAKEEHSLILDFKTRTAKEVSIIECRVCGAEFNYKKSLTQHIAKMSGNPRHIRKSRQSNGATCSDEGNTLLSTYTYFILMLRINHIIGEHVLYSEINT